MSDRIETELGLLPPTWTVKKIDEIKENKKGSIAMGPFGSDIKTDNFVSDGVPIIRGNNLNDFIFGDREFVYLTEEKADSLKNSICYPGDIIFTHRGTIGQVGIIPKYSNYKRYVVSQSGMKLTINKEIVSPEFIHLFFKSRVGQYILLRNKSQVGVPAIGQPTTSLKEMIVPIPPKTESDEIAKTILSIQNKITLLRHQNHDLEELAQTLFKRWFVEFEFPFDFAQGKPNENGEPYKSSGGKMVESELGEIPEGWKVGVIKDFGKIVCGKTPSKQNADFYGNDVPFLKIPDMHGAIFPLNTVDNLSNEGSKSQKNKLIPAKSLVVSCIATVGLVCINPYDCHTNQQINSIVLEKEQSRYYLFHCLKGMMSVLENIGSGGSATLNVNTSVFSNIEILVPSSDALKQHYNIVNPIFERILTNQEEIQTLTQLRDTLLPKLMSGEIKVNE